MSDNPTVAVALLTPFFKYLLEKSISPATLCKKACIDPEILKFPDNRLTLDEFNRLNTAAINITEDINLGFHLGLSFTLASAGIVGYLMMNCKTIGEAYNKYCSYQELPGDIVRIKIASGESNARIYWEYNPRIIYLPSMVMENVTLAVLTMAKELSGIELPIKEASFSYSKPENFKEYFKFFKCQIKFDELETALLFDKKFLDTPVKNPNNQLLEIMENYAKEYLNTYRNSHSLTERIHKLLKVYHGIIPNIGMIASELGMNIRNMQHRLKLEKTTYSIIREKVQQELALEYIKNYKYSICEISQMLGFAEPCIFQRSFKRWTGHAPGQYRKKITNI